MTPRPLPQMESLVLLYRLKCLLPDGSAFMFFSYVHSFGCDCFFFISISLRHETPKLVDHRDLPNENKVVLHSINQTN